MYKVPIKKNGAKERGKTNKSNTKKRYSNSKQIVQNIGSEGENLA